MAALDHTLDGVRDFLGTRAEAGFVNSGGGGFALVFREPGRAHRKALAVGAQFREDRSELLACFGKITIEVFRAVRRKHNPERHGRTRRVKSEKADGFSADGLKGNATKALGMCENGIFQGAPEFWRLCRHAMDRMGRMGP